MGMLRLPSVYELVMVPFPLEYWFSASLNSGGTKDSENRVQRRFSLSEIFLGPSRSSKRASPVTPLYVSYPIILVDAYYFLITLSLLR